MTEEKERNGQNIQTGTSHQKTCHIRMAGEREGCSASSSPGKRGPEAEGRRRDPGACRLCSALEESPEQAVWRAGRGKQEVGLARAPGAVGLGTVAGFCSCVVGSDSHRWGLLTDCVLKETSPERPKCLARMAGGDVSEVGRLERE